jgi:hypothetical protein
MARLRRRIEKQLLWLLGLLFTVLFSGNPADSSAQVPVNGSLRQVGNQQILKIWGTNYEMGYAHGYLMADNIRDLIDTFMVGVVAGGSVSDYNNHLSLMNQYHAFLPESLSEVDGMVAGMRASGKTCMKRVSAGTSTGENIKLFNCLFQYYMSCSSFAVWGNATANGETIVARNYDFFYESQLNTIKDQPLISYEPTGKPRFVSFGWPGWFGVVSGINEDGISVIQSRKRWYLKQFGTVSPFAGSGPPYS